MPLVDDLKEPSTPQEQARRQFLASLGLGALGLTGALGSAMTLRFMRPNVVYELDGRVEVGRASSLAAGTVLVLPEQRIYVVCVAQGIYALSAVCTHLGCITRQDAGGFACPCHGSRFSLAGQVTGGPAPLPLLRLHVELSRGMLVVDANQVIDAHAPLQAVA